MMIMNNQPLLEVRNLKVEIPTRKGTLIALEDVSFNLKAGEILGVVGESGAGKSMVGNSIHRSSRKTCPYHARRDPIGREAY